MRSKASIKGHPLHPILVSFPIAFFSGALVFDLLGWCTAQAPFHTTATYLIMAGLIMAVLAAIPGLTDFLFSVPPKSSGKKRAAIHGLTNTVVLLLFGMAFWYRAQTARPEMSVLIGLELTGEILLLFAGWLGGTLVYRNQIGVDPRYAWAGKWKEEYLQQVNGQVEIKDAGKMKTDQMRLIHVDGKRIVVAKTEEGYTAFDDRCTHKGGSLAGGAMICGMVQCPWHGSQFDTHTGALKAGPAKESIKTYPLQMTNGKLYLAIS